MFPAAATEHLQPWMEQVEWARGNALEPRTYEDHISGAMAVISTIGAFGTQEEMLKVGTWEGLFFFMDGNSGAGLEGPS